MLILPMKIDKKSLLFIISALMIIVFILYLGGRAIKHEVLSRQYQSAQLAQSHLNTINLLVKSLLEQKANHIATLVNVLETNEHSINALIADELEIKNAFVMRDNQLVYPAELAVDQQTMSDDVAWRQIITTIMQDASVLAAHYIDSEQANPRHGWYLTYDNHGPVLIYWLKQSEQIIGFQLSYVKLLFDLIVELDNKQLSYPFIITDNGQVIYSNENQSVDAHLSSEVMSIAADYPLKSWQIEYYYQYENNNLLYSLGITILVMLCLCIGGIFIYSYREYTRTLRLAKQQVSFVGQVSHEFKTPLTNISLYAEMLKERLEDEPEPIPEYLDIITQESQRLTRLIQNVLNFTKSANLNIKKVHLNTLLEKTCCVFRPVLTQKSITLNFTPNDDIDVLATDADKLVQIINNFLSNSEKYAAHGKQIDLSIGCHDDSVSISVRDYGDGIPNQALSMIFKPFYRINSSLTEGVSGTGIGLTIAQQLAIQLQGNITVKNCQPGVEFTLTLPIKIQQ